MNKKQIATKDLDSFFNELLDSLKEYKELPDLNRLEARLKNAEKHKVESESINEHLRRIRIYLDPYYMFHKEAELSPIAETDEELKIKKKIDNTIKKEEKIANDTKVISESDHLDIMMVYDNVRKCNQLDSRRKQYIRKLNSLNNKFTLPDLKQIESNDRLPTVNEARYYKKYYSDSDFKDIINNYRVQLVSILRKYSTGKISIIPLSTEESITQMESITVDDFWNQRYEYKTNKVKYNKGYLAKLYDELVKRNYIEANKLIEFVSIFSIFSHEISHNLPIKWTCPCSYSSAKDTSSNLTTLYYLVTALRNPKLFQNNKKAVLLPHDKKLIAKYFCHQNGERINVNSLNLSPNRKALEVIKDIFKEFHYLDLPN